MATAKQIIDKALSYVGTYDRGMNDVIFNTHYYGTPVSGSAYPWCCAFVWDIFRMCGASELFNGGKKTAYCPTVLNWGKAAGLAVPKTDGKYGDIVLFDWDGDGVADHIGLIIAKNADGSYQTIEGNTASYNYSNGGYVLRITRYTSQIIGIIRPKYDGTTSKPTTDTGSGKDVYYQVFTEVNGWLPVVRNREDYAGEDGEAIEGVKVFVDGAEVTVTAHHMANGAIDKLTIDGGKTVLRYRVRLKNGAYLDYMENTKDTGGSSDTYAGIAGREIDRLEIEVRR